MEEDHYYGGYKGDQADSENLHNKGKLLIFNPKQMAKTASENEDPNIYDANPVGFKPKEKPISSIAQKVLDAPGIEDDFYLNLLDWSSTNKLAIALN